MPKPLFFSLAVLLSIALGARTLAQAATDNTASRKPNFIIINIDDLGYADIGPFGSTTSTPQLDRMAKEGMKLTSHYAAPVCSPSRAALMTGCYPKRALPIPHVLFPSAHVGLNPNEVTIAEVLKDAGYTTACIGKWHLGDQKPFLPTSQGFDSYYGIPYSNDMGPASEGAKSNPDKPLPAPNANPNRPRANANVTGDADGTGVRNPQPPLPLVENDKVIARLRAEDQFQFTKNYTERAVKFIREHQEQPFFLYLPHSAVHFPLYPSKEYMGKSPNGLLGDWAQEVDWSVGRVLDTLRELKLDANTLVIFTSDNGGSVPHGSNNKPLRGSKASTWEGGIRVCTIAWWPGKVPAGTSSDAITSMMDVLPTLAKLGGGKVPTDRKIDGVDIWPVLAGDAKDTAKAPRTEFYYFRGPTLDAVRSGDWKLHLAIRNGPPNKPTGEPHVELYNLKDDISEASNVAKEHPDVVARLQAMAKSMEGDLGTKEFGPASRPLGRVENPQPFISLDGTVRADAVGTSKTLP
ncbi:sulfatase [Roseimicrobium sp. ORNL1]|uniref:sulfatase family protein n=1 Tax=Roseimicrobium sp. ORNL1 TaxID=2711231 RepID=UPI0013E1D8A6|nr:sulfatase [Roseimicrobium sp. ORNL1]